MKVFLDFDKFIICEVVFNRGKNEKIMLLNRCDIFLTNGVYTEELLNKVFRKSFDTLLKKFRLRYDLNQKILEDITQERVKQRLVRDKRSKKIINKILTSFIENV